MTTNVQLAKELKEHKEDTDKKFDMLLGSMEKLTAQFTPENAPVKSSGPYMVTEPEEEHTAPTIDEASAESSMFALNPAYQKIFEEYFDPEDGFTARLEGVNFTIVVPTKLSNADEAWKKFYKVDTRQKVLRSDNVEGDMRDWCRMVAGNLKYNRSVQLKT